MLVAVGAGAPGGAICDGGATGGGATETEEGLFGVTDTGAAAVVLASEEAPSSDFEQADKPRAKIEQINDSLRICIDNTLL